MPAGDDTAEQMDVHRMHLLQTLQALEYMKTVDVPPLTALKGKMVRLPPPLRPNIKKTILFDLDETLVHCVDDNELENP